MLAWPDLLAHLATLTLNEVGLPMKGTATFAMPARPTALQEKAFALLGLPLPRVQREVLGRRKIAFLINGLKQR